MIGRLGLAVVVGAIASGSGTPLQRGLASGEPLLEPELVQVVYAAHGNSLLWHEPFGRLRATGRDLIRVVEDAGADGLDPARYHLATLRLLSAATRREQIETEDVLLTDAFLALGHDLRDGRLRGRAELPTDRSLSGALEEALQTGAVAAALSDLAPPSDDYASLRALLARYQGLATGGGGPPLGEDETALREQRIATLEVNLERLRWQPRDPGNPVVLVNIPDFSLLYLADGAPLLSSRVVVGLNAPRRQTPLLDSRIESVVVNPRWEVPVSIAREELWPRIAAHPELLPEEGIHLLDRRGRELEAAEVDASDFEGDSPSVRLVQDPGPANPLGSVKIVFPNDQSIYLHDTPHRSTFERAYRDASHGCVRVEKALELAALLLRGTGWNQSVLEEAIGTGKTRMVPLARPVAVHFVYRTAWVDAQGALQLRPDIYGLDAEVARALHPPAGGG